MATINYPTSKDTSANTNGRPSATDVMTGGTTYGGPEVIDKIYTEIEALQTKVGITSDPSTSTVDYKLSGVAAGDKAMSKTGVETATNKTFTSPTITSPTYSGTASGTLAGLTLITPTFTTPTYKGNINGYIDLNLSVTRTGAQTCTVPGDVTGYIGPGDRVTLTDTTTKYFNILSASFGAGVTTITFITSTDYALVGNPSTFFYSHGNPAGFPYWFNYTPTIAGNGSMTISGSTTGTAKFSVNGRSLTLDLRVTTMTVGGTPNTIITVTLPATAGASAWYGSGISKDSGYLLLCNEIGSGSSLWNFYAAANLSTSWTAGSTREIYGTITYQF